jgi:lysophospholipase L1-like esterase
MNGTVVNTYLPVLISKIARIASHFSSARVYFFDLHKKLIEIGNSTWSCDGCHPTPAANMRIAEEIIGYLLQIREKE